MLDIRRNFSRHRLFCQPRYRTQTLDAMASQRSRARSAHPWLHRLVFRLDACLRRWTLVTEYSPDPRCLFRVRLGHLDQDVALPDGTIAHAGDRVIDLHLWNEHVPLMPKQGATIAWARRMCFCIEVSLRELAKHLMARPELDDISVIRANVTFGVFLNRAPKCPGCPSALQHLCLLRTADHLKAVTRPVIALT